jgi:beta-1,4-mannosyl-glycoprotein beta-1,4-N-acetylglucosaminyltransferase
LLNYINFFDIIDIYIEYMIQIILTIHQEDIKNIQNIIKSLVNQTIKPDKIILYLISELDGHDSSGLPEELTDSNLVHIEYVTENYGNLTDLYHIYNTALHNDDIIIRIIDYIMLEQHFIEEFMEAHKLYPNEVLGFLGIEDSTYHHAEFIQGYNRPNRLYKKLFSGSLLGYRGLLFPENIDARTIIESIKNIDNELKKSNLSIEDNDDCVINSILKQMNIDKIIIGTLYPGNLASRSIGDIINIKFLDSINKSLIDQNKSQLSKEIIQTFFNRPSKRKIIDCFIMFNEIDMLRARLEYIPADYYVIIESERTHSNHHKSLILTNLLKDPPNWLQQYINKLKVIILSGDEIDKNLIYQKDIDHINKSVKWGIEYAQRNLIKKGIDQLNLNNTDLIMMSDIDEFPDREQLLVLRDNYSGRSIFHQYFFYYSFRWIKPKKWYGTLVVEYQDLFSITPQEYRSWRLGYSQKILEGGWHCSYFGSSEQICKKLANIVEGASFFGNDIHLDDISKLVSNGQDPYGRENEDLIQNTNNDILPPFSELIDPIMK